MVDYDMLQKKRNIAVGIFVLIALASLVWLIFIFGDLPVVISKARSYEIYVQFPRAPGLQPNTPVQFCGYQIGRVVTVEPPAVFKDAETGKSYYQVRAVFAIQKKYRDIPSNVKIVLMRRGLGSSYIEILHDPDKPVAEPKDPNRPETAFLVNGMLMEGTTGTASEFFPEETQAKLDELVTSLNKLAKSADEIIGNKENQQNLRQTLANLREMSKEATDALRDFQTLSVSGKENLDRVSDSLVNTSDQLAEAARQMQLILEKANRGEGSAGKFINDARLYENLMDTTEELNSTLGQFKELMVKWKKDGIKLKLF